MKLNVVHYTRPEAVVSYMNSIKQLFDPTNILNPDTVLP